MRKVVSVVVVVALVVEIVSLLLVDRGADDDSAPAASSPNGPPAASPTTSTIQQSGGPITDACGLVSVDAVAKAVQVQAARIQPQPRAQDPTVGATCNFVEQSEDNLVVFTVLTQEAGDPTLARETIERRSGKKMADLGDAAVLEQSENGSRISVAKGPRYVQLQTQRKPASDEAMAELARQAVSKL